MQIDKSNISMLPSCVQCKKYQTVELVTLGSGDEECIQCYAKRVAELEKVRKIINNI